jgi:hypothetical protein
VGGGGKKGKTIFEEAALGSFTSSYPTASPLHSHSLLTLACVSTSTYLRRSVSDDVSRGDLLSERLSGDPLSDHGTEDSHHGCAALVDLHVKLKRVDVRKRGVRRRRGGGGGLGRV